MAFDPKELKKEKDLSIIAKGIRLNDVIDHNFLRFLEEKYSDKYNLRISELSILLLPKEEKKQKTKKGMNVVIGIVPNLRIIHTSEDDFKNKEVIINSSHYDLLDKLMNKKKV